MGWIKKYKRGWRTAVLALLLLGFLGPWTYESTYLPIEAMCNGILFENGSCGLTIPGVFNLIGWLLAPSSFIGTLLGWPQLYLLIILTLNMILTLLSLSRFDQVSRVLPLGWGLAVGAGLTLILPGAPRTHPALWGIWLSLGLAMIMLILEICVWLRQPSRPIQLFGSVLLLFLLAGCYSFSFEQPPRVQEIALADLDGDGDLDAYLAIGPGGEPYHHPDYVLFNEGSGQFTDSGQSLDDFNSFSVALGDVNGDGSIDAVQGRRVYLNDGSGMFGPGSARLGPIQDGEFKLNVALIDLDDNGSLDAFGAACCGGARQITSTTLQPLFSFDQVWLNEGAARFRRTRQPLAQTGSNAVALGDLNGDGSPDAFIVSGQSTLATGDTVSKTPNTVWFNDGKGNFNDSGQQLGNAESLAVALGDVNGDGFLDAVVGNRDRDEAWLNDGLGNFSKSRQRLGNSFTYSIFLADLDGDGHLDIFVGAEEEGRAWFNDGAGNFTKSSQKIDYGRYDGITLGDVTGDGLLDVFVVGVESYQVWRGEGNGRFTADNRVDYR